MKNLKIEIFQRNLEEAGFSKDFIIQSLHYFKEIEEEAEVQGISVEDTLNYYNRVGSFTCNALQSFYNLHNFREDILLLKEQYPELIDLSLYFKNIEKFEISILYLLFFYYYPSDEIE